MLVSLTVPVYAIGDVAFLIQDGAPPPGLAQVAQQQGMFLGRELRLRSDARPFRYRTKGGTAVIGRHAAVYTYGRFKLKGPLGLAAMGDRAHLLAGRLPQADVRYDPVDLALHHR